MSVSKMKSPVYIWSSQWVSGKQVLLLTFSLNLGFANGHKKVRREGLLRHGKGGAIHELTFQHHHWVGVTDSGLKQPLRILT